MHMDIDTNMQMIGKREPYYATFTVRIITVTTEEFVMMVFVLVFFLAPFRIRLAALTVVLSTA